MAKSIVPSAFFKLAINMKATGNHTVVPAMSGKFFQPIAAYVQWTAYSGTVTANPVAGIYADSGGGTTLWQDQALAAISPEGGHSVITFSGPGDGSNIWVADLTNPIYMAIAVAGATDGLLSASLYVEGLVF
jgi:hypothetical protein